MEEKLISIVVPVYNVEKYLDRSMKSLLGQTYRNLEIILVDDGATDSSGQLCDMYKEKDPRITVIHKKNGGVSSARNMGMDACHGDYIGFMDPDDEIKPDMYKKLKEAMDEYKLDVAMCGVEYVYPDGKHVVQTDVKEIFNDNKEALMWYMKDGRQQDCAVTKLYTRELLKDIRFSEESHNGEDGLFSLKCIGKSRRSAYIGENMYFYYMNQDSVLHRKFDAKTASLWKSRYAMVKECLDNNYNFVFDDAIRKLMYSIYVVLLHEKKGFVVGEKDRADISSVIKKYKKYYFKSVKDSFKNKLRFWMATSGLKPVQCFFKKFIASRVQD